MVDEKGVQHDRDGNQAKKSSTHTTDAVTKVEQTRSESREGHSEAEPRKDWSAIKHTGTLVGEEDLGLDTHGERDTLACRPLQERLGRHGALEGNVVSVLPHVDPHARVQKFIHIYPASLAARACNIRLWYSVRRVL